MAEKLSLGTLLAFVLAVFGLYFLINLIIRPLLPWLTGYLNSRAEKSKQDPVKTLDMAIRRENKKDIVHAQENFAYSKLVELSDTTKSFREQLSDLDSVKVRQLPENFKLRRLLWNILKRYDSPNLRSQPESPGWDYAIRLFFYFLGVDTNTKKMMSTSSVLITEIAVAIVLFFSQYIDNLTISQLIVYLILLIGIPALTFLTHHLRPNNLVLLLLVTCAVVWVYFYLYQNSYHKGVTSISDTTSNISMKCPKWITGEEIKNCQSLANIKTSTPVPRTIAIGYSETFLYATDQNCKDPKYPEYVLDLRNPVSFHVKLNEDYKSTLPPNTNVSIFLMDSNGMNTAMDKLSCEIYIENNFWLFIKNIIIAILLVLAPIINLLINLFRGNK
jgi:hypothetical protein